MNNDIDYVSLARLERMVESLSKHPYLEDKEEIQVSFEYIVGSLFPDILDNIKDEITKSYIQGYNDGIKNKENENQISDRRRYM